MVHLYHTSHKCISCHNLTKTLYLTIFCLTSHQGCCQPTASQCHLNKMLMTWNARLSLQHFTITITDADLLGVSDRPAVQHHYCAIQLGERNRWV